MNEQTRIHLTNLQNKLKEISRYSHCARLMSFDRETIAPKDALENENETLDFLYAKIFEIKKTKEYEESIVYLHDHIDELEPLDQRLITLLYRNYEDNINVTPELDARRNTLFNKAYVDWLKAKSESNYSLFSSDLKDIIEITKEFIDLRPAKKEIIYDNLIGEYEEGMTTEKLDKFFNSLKERIVPLLRKIQNSKTKIRTDFLTRPVSIEKQAKFSEYLLNVIGFDFNKGMLSTTEHPFTSDIGYNDVRVTTHYYENLFLSNVYSVIHEGGHAIFGQCETQDKYDHFIDQSMTMAMHESVSRFYENRIGRSREFIHLIYPKFKELFASYDAFIMPVGSGVAKKFESDKDVLDESELDVLEEHLQIGNFGGFPSITIPNGLIDGLPVGVNITGNCYDDQNVLNIAYALENVMEYKNMIAKEVK